MKIIASTIPHRTALLLLLLVSPLLLPLPAAAGMAEKSVAITGVLTDEGVECQALRSDGGPLYTLSGDLKGFKTGDRVRVNGTIAEVSTCQQGMTIEVRKITADRSQDQNGKSKVVKVTGVLTDEGVECPALRGDDGQLYTLNRGATEGFKIGDRVRVVGKVAERSFCNQGTTLDVQSIKLAKE